METLAPVDLDLGAMRRVVEAEGGCIVWGGTVRLSPADDVFIRIERALDIDTAGQLVASVLSKKAAAGATHLVLDVPVGPTAKVRTPADAERLQALLRAVSTALGLHTEIVLGDGAQPVGRGIGPALEAQDVLAVLKREAGAPADLREKSLGLAGAVLELAGAVPAGEGLGKARAVLERGEAWGKFQAICAAQGGPREPPVAAHRQTVEAAASGRLGAIDNRRLSRVAKLAGAPAAKAAGVELHVRLGEAVQAGQPVYTLHAESRGELAYALDYARTRPETFLIESGG
jgi:thymidine phosphorylase